MKLEAIRPISITLAREIALTAALLLGVSLVVFVILFLAPGDPFAVLLADQSDAGARTEASEALGFAASWYSQYFAWLGNMLQGDFGASIRTGQPVLGEILAAGFKTLQLTLAAMVVTFLVAMPIAIYTALRGLTKIGWPATMFAYIVSSLPVFWLGYIAIYISTQYFDFFPLGLGFSEDDKAWLKFLIPVLVLGIGSGTIGEVVRYMRHELTRVMDEEYIRTARAKGAAVWRHAFKEGVLLPTTEIFAAKIPFILGGAIIVEQIFNWPGMGRMAWQAAQDRDFPLIMGVVIAAAVLVRGGTLLHRVIYIFVNPRASHQ